MLRATAQTDGKDKTGDPMIASFISPKRAFHAGSPVIPRKAGLGNHFLRSGVYPSIHRVPEH
jgi:hypothetical protein